MANLTLNLNINSASNLLNVNLITKMDVYAVITIHGENTRTKQKAKTNLHRSAGSNPIWNHEVNFCVNERLARDGRLTLVMRLISRRVLGNKDIGRVHVPLLELLNSAMPSVNSVDNNQEMKFMTYQVRTMSGKRSGVLNFSYQFKPDSSTIVNRSMVESTYPPQSQIEHPLSAPPELSFEFSNKKNPFAAGTRNDHLPVSYGDVISEPPYFRLTTPPNHHSYGPYGYAPPSPPRHGYGSPTMAWAWIGSWGFGLTHDGRYSV